MGLLQMSGENILGTRSEKVGVVGSFFDEVIVVVLGGKRVGFCYVVVVGVGVGVQCERKRWARARLSSEVKCWTPIHFSERVGQVAAVLSGSAALLHFGNCPKKPILETDLGKKEKCGVREWGDFLRGSLISFPVDSRNLTVDVSRGTKEDVEEGDRPPF